MYYIISFLYQKMQYFSLWVSGENNDYVICSKGHIITFSTLNDLLKYAFDNGIDFDTLSVTTYDLDEIVVLCKNHKLIKADCNILIDFWNICTDVSNGLNIHFIGEKAEYDRIYEKLFYGTNITNTSNNEYSPTFDATEIDMLLNVMVEGISMIVSNLIK